jgi:hypothetical protein
MNTATNLAFTLANGLATQLITLALAMIGLSVTFAKDFQKNTLTIRLLLILTGTIFFFSILCGIMNIKALISIIVLVKPSDVSVAFSNDALQWASRQEYLFYAGLILFILQGLAAIFAGPREKS